MATDPQGPSFPVGGPTTNSWREHSLTRARELRYVVDWIALSSDPKGADPATQAAVAAIKDHLDAGEKAAEGDGDKRGLLNRAKVAFGGAAIERANSNLDAAESEVLGLASLAYVRGQMQNLLAHVRGHLPADDARRMRIEEIASCAMAPADEIERDAVVAAVRIASIESRREISRLRSFRNILLATALVLTLAMAGLVVLGALNPRVIPLCFNPVQNEIVCPTSVERVATPVPYAPGSQVEIDAAIRDAAGTWDIPVVALMGIVAAAVAAAVSLGGIKGTSTPYSLPIALAVLKLPSGALTAFLGLLLIRGGFVPGLSALDSPAQILAWAILFGYAQQLLTGVIDKQAQTVLADVASADRPPVKVPDFRTGTPTPPRDTSLQI